MVNMCDRGAYAMRLMEDLPKGEAKLAKVRMYYKEELRITKNQLLAAEKSEKRAKALTKVTSAKSKEWHDSSDRWEKKAGDRATEIEVLRAEVTRLQGVEIGLREQDEQRENAMEELRRSFEAEKTASQTKIEGLTNSLRGLRENYDSQQTLLKSAKIDAITWYKSSSFFRNHLSRFAAMFFARGMEAGAKQMVRRTPGAVDLELDYEATEGVPFPQFKLVDYPDDDLESEISAGSVSVIPSSHKRV